MNATHIDLLLKNCKAYAMDEKNTCYTTIGIHGGRIVYTGQADENSAPCAKTVIDMAGRPVLPAFTDTHMHMINSAYLKTIFRLFGVTSIKRVIEMGKEYLKSGEFSRERWVFGRGWNQELFEEGRMITRDDLDEISSSVPICIVRICGHIAVLNSAALELLRASAEVEAYAHNIDWDSGVLRESAVKYCYKIMPPIPKPIMKNLIDMAQRALLSQGITAVGTDDFILFAAVLVIVVCKIVFSVDTKTTLMLSGAIGGIICMIWGFKWEDIESKFAEGIKSTAMPIVLLIVIGMMVASWILSGTIPTMTYYGMKLLAPGQFLFLSCILCSVMSVCTGTSWGTVSTLGVALLGVAMGLGIPIEMTAGAIVVGSFFGDKMSPLSDSTVLAASCARVNLLDHVKHMYYSTVPAMLVSLVLFFVLGFRFKGGAISGADYDEILAGLDASFNLNLLTLLPPIVVLVLVLMKKPAIPTFGAGIVVAFIIGIVTQGADPIEMLNAMSKGVSMETGISIVDKLVNRGGIVSMLDTIGLILSAAIFAAPMRASGSVNAIFEAVKKVAKTPTQFMVLALIMQPVLLVATTSYFVTMPVTGELAADAMDELGYSRLNLSRMMEDGGTVVCPLIPWGNTGAFITATLGVTPYEYFFYMPFIWLCFVFDMLSIVTGIGLKKADGSMVTPLFKRKAS